MNRWPIPAALTLGASIVASCVVYGPEDLEGTSQSGGTPGVGGSGSGRGGGGTGIQGGQAGEPQTGGSPSGNGGALPAGAGGGGRGGEPMGGDGGDLGTAGTTPGGTAGAGAGGTSAGTSGTGGAPVVDKSLIDNMDDGDNRIEFVADPAGQRRNGYWYTYATGTYAELLPPSEATVFMTDHPEGTRGPGEAPNPKAFRLYAKQVAAAPGNGAAAGFNLVHEKAVYDASQYVGVSFWARASKALRFRLQLAIKGTDVDGGECMPASECSDHYFKQVDVGTAWTKIDAHWDTGEFFQEGWGDEAIFEPAELVSIQFFVPAAATTPDVELWIDDIAFIPPR